MIANGNAEIFCVDATPHIDSEHEFSRFTVKDAKYTMRLVRFPLSLCMSCHCMIIPTLQCDPHAMNGKLGNRMTYQIAALRN